MKNFRALYSDFITLHLITEENLAEVCERFQGYTDSEEMIAEINENYLPRYEPLSANGEKTGKRTRYGFYAMLENKLAGLSLLDIHDWQTLTGSTGADTLVSMRGKGVAPRSKPHLFYVAFELLGLHRIETGCFVSNTASKKSIEKTIGFQYEGLSRKSGVNDDGEYEDEYRYAILREDWMKLYDKNKIEVIY